MPLRSSSVCSFVFLCLFGLMESGCKSRAISQSSDSPAPLEDKSVTSSPNQGTIGNGGSVVELPSGVVSANHYYDAPEFTLPDYYLGKVSDFDSVFPGTRKELARMMKIIGRRYKQFNWWDVGTQVLCEPEDFEIYVTSRLSENLPLSVSPSVKSKQVAYTYRFMPKPGHNQKIVEVLPDIFELSPRLQALIFLEESLHHHPHLGFEPYFDGTIADFISGLDTLLQVAERQQLVDDLTQIRLRSAELEGIANYHKALAYIAKKEVISPQLTDIGGTPIWTWLETREIGFNFGRGIHGLSPSGGLIGFTFARDEIPIDVDSNLIDASSVVIFSPGYIKKGSPKEYEFSGNQVFNSRLNGFSFQRKFPCHNNVIRNIDSKLTFRCFGNRNQIENIYAPGDYQSVHIHGDDNLVSDIRGNGFIIFGDDTRIESSYIDLDHNGLLVRRSSSYPEMPESFVGLLGMSIIFQSNSRVENSLVHATKKNILFPENFTLSSQVGGIGWKTEVDDLESYEFKSLRVCILPVLADPWAIIEKSSSCHCPYDRIYKNSSGGGDNYATVFSLYSSYPIEKSCLVRELTDPVEYYNRPDMSTRIRANLEQDDKYEHSFQQVY